jgi:hypothetical protein
MIEVTNILPKLSGSILPDIFAIIVFIINNRISSNSDKIQSFVANMKISLNPQKQWNLSNQVDTMIHREILTRTFYLPGLISLVSYCSMILGANYQFWMVLTIIGYIMIITVDIWYIITNLQKMTIMVRNRHKMIIIVLLTLIIANKIFVISFSY